MSRRDLGTSRMRSPCRSSLTDSAKFRQRDIADQLDSSGHGQGCLSSQDVSLPPTKENTIFQGDIVFCVH
uniref:Uncharacterized protein n=2 Tax=Anguilla anguilla TaxID=7936 RepID=A0A0E9S651_ANGAN